MEIIGFQIIKKDTLEYPEDLHTFEVFTLESLEYYLSVRHDNRHHEYYILPIYKDTIEDPVFIEY